MPDNTTEFLIVGAGIAGASLAYALTRAGASDIMVVDGEASGSYHASGRSAAMYMAGYGNAPVRALTRQSFAFLDTPPPDFADGPLLRRRGHLTIAGEADTSLLREMAGNANADILDADAARAIVPPLRPEATATAFFDPDASDIDTDLLHQSYIRHARRAGARFLTDTPFHGAQRAVGGWTAQVGAEEIRARTVICAAGAWADQVAQSCGVAAVGLVPMRRTALLVAPPEEWEIENWPMVMTAAESLYFKPDAGKLLVSPADETPDAPGDVQPDEWDVAVAAHRLQERLDIDVRRIDAQWAGLRTFAPDRTPVVGFDADSPDFFWFAGQGGYGFQLAPALAAAGAAMLAGQPPEGDDIDWRSIAANRFCGATQA